MYQKNKIEVLLALEEDRKIMKLIKFYLITETSEPRMRLTTFERNLDKDSYTLTLISGEETPSFELEPEKGTPWISISSPEEMSLSDKNLPNFLGSIISKDHMRKQIQERIESFKNGM
jgi:hypothetical protein